MNKILLSFLLVLPMPAMAMKGEDLFYTHTAQKCMKLRECTEGVTEVTPEGRSDEVKEILNKLKVINVKVYEAIPQYFVNQNRALYFPDKNTIYINRMYSGVPGVFINLLRHEAWHAAQDCAVGLHNSSITPLRKHMDVPVEYKKDALLRYGTSDPFTFKVEREALWAGDTPGMTSKELDLCIGLKNGS
tara:strand:+ start:271 stop:837 length:567 start_codon:yes stop_codon:yes gene_type:complete